MSGKDPARRWFRPGVERLEERILLDAQAGRLMPGVGLSTYLQAIYQDDLGRDPDPTGTATFNSQYAGGASLGQIDL